MTARTKQQLYDQFSSGGSAKHSISQIETEFEDLIDTFFGTLTDHASTSTIVGWSSYTEKVIEYKISCNLIFVNFRIAGTSNNSGARFSVPFASGQTGVPLFFCRSVDNGGSAVAAYGKFTDTTTATLYATAASGAWTTSGTKSVYGQFCYVKS